MTYLAHTRSTGSGTGLYSVDDRMTLTRHAESVPGTYANRMVHAPSLQLVIGPHLIDAGRRVGTIDALVDHRLTATMTHLHDPKNKVYFLTMEGMLFEADVHTLQVSQLFDLKKELKLPDGAYPHFKGGYTGAGRVVVSNNTYSEDDQAGHPTGGRLGEWTGERWTVLEETAFCEVTGRPSAVHATILATGWDRASVLLKVLAGGRWQTYRLPVGSHCYEHMWYTEWPRIREVGTERLLMDTQRPLLRAAAARVRGARVGDQAGLPAPAHGPDILHLARHARTAGDQEPRSAAISSGRAAVEPVVRQDRRPLVLRQAAGVGRRPGGKPRSCQIIHPTHS